MMFILPNGLKFAHFTFFQIIQSIIVGIRILFI